MRKNIVLFIFVAASSLLLSQTVYHIDSKNPVANDANLGTDANAPWKSLNLSKWNTLFNNGDIVRISAGIYTYGNATGAIISKNVTIIGDTKETVIIQGVDDATFNAKNTIGNIGNAKFVKIAGTGGNFNTVNFKRMTLRNSILPGTNYDGGFFEIGTGNSLVLEDMVIENTYFPTRYGGAIRSKGNLSCSDVTFQNCTAMQGGAVFTSESGIYNFSHCKFLNNSTAENTSGHKFGGAMFFGGVSVNVTINDCLFESNKSDHSQGANADYTKKPEGGAISLRALANTKLNVSINNSAFVNNYAYNLGAAISTSVTGGTPETNIKLDIRNSTFTGNKISTDVISEGTCLNISNNLDYTGSIALINNTFYNNSIESNSHRSVKIPNSKLDVVIINNLFLDALSGKGFSLAIQGGAGHSQGNLLSVTGRGNVADKMGGSLFSSNWDGFNWANKEFKNLKGITMDKVMLKTEMQKNKSGIPYFMFGDGSILTDGGLSSFKINESECVPQTDINGQKIKGSSKDIGAFEK